MSLSLSFSVSCLSPCLSPYHVSLPLPLGHVILHVVLARFFMSLVSDFADACLPTVRRAALPAELMTAPVHGCIVCA
jgi:hypothetical protein